ncbi:hypothetical protein [Roseivirga pacifica]|uniref:hypothetical protein n=1 Tax=Roseivirga pacifica TaxID=1267423 RepID=UPI00227A7ED1|nr:hypothetical protein [Roseivirga pacifica]
MKMRKLHVRALLLSISGALLLQACNDAPSAEGEETRLAVSNDVASLSSRVAMKNQSVGLNTNGGGSKGAANLAASTMDDSTYELIAEIASPSLKGNTLSATHVRLDGDQAFVTYHINGAEYGGGFEVINLANEANISITGQALYNDTNMNALAVDTEVDLDGNTQRVYLAGANGSGAIVEKLDITNGLVTENTQTLELPGPNANGVIRTRHMLYVTAGGRSGDGGVVAVDVRNGSNHFTINETENYADAKDVATTGGDVNDDMVVLKGGTNSSIEIYRVAANGLNKRGNSAAGSMNVVDGKNTVVIDAGLAYTAMSDLGVKIFDLNSSSATEEYHLPSTAFGGGLSNGIAVDEDKIYIANGTSGLFIADKPIGSNLTVNGVLNLSGSANFVAANDSYIVVANGTGGVKVLKRIAPEIDACANGDTWNINTNPSAKVERNQTIIKSGSIAFRNDLNVEGELYYCGAMQVGSNLLVQNGGKFDMNGSLVVNRDLNLGSNSTLVIEGSLTIQGNFNFGGTIIFKGSGSSLQVSGNVNNNGGKSEGTWSGRQL